MDERKGSGTGGRLNQNKPLSKKPGLQKQKKVGAAGEGGGVYEGESGQEVKQALPVSGPAMGNEGRPRLRGKGVRRSHRKTCTDSQETRSSTRRKDWNLLGAALWMKEGPAYKYGEWRVLEKVYWPVVSAVSKRKIRLATRSTMSRGG